LRQTLVPTSEILLTWGRSAVERLEHRKYAIPEFLQHTGLHIQHMIPLSCLSATVIMPNCELQMSSQKSQLEFAQPDDTRSGS